MYPPVSDGPSPEKKTRNLTIKNQNMWKWRCFLLPEKTSLDAKKPLSSWNILWDSKVGAFTSSQTGIFWKKFHSQIPSKLSSQIFCEVATLKVPIVPMQRIFFWNLRCSTRSSVDDANRTDLLSVQLNLRKVGTWNSLRWALDTFVAGGHGS